MAMHARHPLGTTPAATDYFAAQDREENVFRTRNVVVTILPFLAMSATRSFDARQFVLSDHP